MNNYYISLDIINELEKERNWGSIAQLYNGSMIDPKNSVAVSIVTYREPHYSGFHDRYELLLILSGKGIARINNTEIEFSPTSLIIIPPNTEHEVISIIECPVRAALIQFA